MFKWEYIIEDKKTGKIISRIENSLQWTFYNYAQVSFFNSWYALSWVLDDPDLHLGIDDTPSTKWDSETTSWVFNNYWVVKEQTIGPLKKVEWERVDWDNGYAQVAFEVPAWNQQVVYEIWIVSNVLWSDGGNSRFWLSRAVNSSWVSIPDWGAVIYYRINIDFSTLTSQDSQPMSQWIIKWKDGDNGWYFDSLFFSPGDTNLNDFSPIFEAWTSDQTLENTATELGSFLSTNLLFPYVDKKVQETSGDKQIQYLEFSVTIKNVDPGTTIKEVALTKVLPFLRTTAITQTFNTSEDELEISFALTLN